MGSPLTLRDVAKMIDHSLLQPTLTDSDIAAGLNLCRTYNVATACVKPYSIPQAAEALDGTDVLVCAVIGFPHGNSTTAMKVAEAAAAVDAGAPEIDMVVNAGKVLGGQYDYVQQEIAEINQAVVDRGGLLKVIFENDFLTDDHIVRLCHICSEIGVAFVKTSTGYGYVKQPNGDYNYKGATEHHVRLMRQHCAPEVQIKAAGGIRKLDDLLKMREAGATRIGATATKAMLEEMKARLEGRAFEPTGPAAPGY